MKEGVVSFTRIVVGERHYALNAGAEDAHLDIIFVKAASFP